MCNCFSLDTNCSSHSHHGFLSRRFRAFYEQLLVLGSGETISAIRRLQDSRKYFAFGKQSRHGLDGNVFQSRFNGIKSRQTWHSDVSTFLGGSDV